MGRPVRIVDPGHELVCGSIGMGKSYWILYKIVQSFKYHRPCCYIDPKGDTYQALLAYFSNTADGRRLWQTYRHRIILVDPVSPCNRFVSFNAIAPVQQLSYARIDPVALLANFLTSHLRRQSGYEANEAMRMQSIMAGAVSLLVEAGKGKLTLAELPLLFVPSYRKEYARQVSEPFNPFVRYLLEHCQHQGTLSFWRDQWASWPAFVRRQWVQSTMNRMFPFLHDRGMINSVCTVDNARLDFREVVEKGKWLFVNVPYPLLTDTNATLLGNLIITNLFYACMQRPMGGRQYRLILDEARFFTSGPLDVILETSRAYNLWLTLVVQSMDQLVRNREGRLDLHLRQTAANLVRYFTVFHNTNPEDTRLLAELMFPVTGTVEIGQRPNGWPDRMPILAEIDEHRRRFAKLQHREAYIFDKLSGEARVWITPQVRLKMPTSTQLAQFEEAHLKSSGVPGEQIAAEISQRQERIRRFLDYATQGKRPIPPPRIAERIS